MICVSSAAQNRRNQYSPYPLRSTASNTTLLRPVSSKSIRLSTQSYCQLIAVFLKVDAFLAFFEDPVLWPTDSQENRKVRAKIHPDGHPRVVGTSRTTAATDCAPFFSTIPTPTHTFPIWKSSLKFDVFSFFSLLAQFFELTDGTFDYQNPFQLSFRPEFYFFYLNDPLVLF